MKKGLLKYTILILSTIAFLSCEKKEVYAPKIVAQGQIQFQVQDANVIAANVGVVQPSFDIISARFSKATTSSAFYSAGNVVINVNLSSNYTNLTINYLTTEPAGSACPGCLAREQKATFSGIAGNVTWTQPIATLTYKGVPVSTSAAGVTHNLEFVASNADGTISNTRVFQLVLLN